MFWQCEQWQSQRQPYVVAMRNVIDRAPGYFQDQLEHIISLPCFRVCGILPEDPEIIAAYDNIPHD